MDSDLPLNVSRETLQHKVLKVAGKNWSASAGMLGSSRRSGEDDEDEEDDEEKAMMRTTRRRPSRTQHRVLEEVQEHQARHHRDSANRSKCRAPEVQVVDVGEGYTSFEQYVENMKDLKAITTCGEA